MSASNPSSKINPYIEQKENNQKAAQTQSVPNGVGFSVKIYQQNLLTFKKTLLLSAPLLFMIMFQNV